MDERYRVRGTPPLRAGQSAASTSSQIRRTLRLTGPSAVGSKPSGAVELSGLGWGANSSVPLGRWGGFSLAARRSLPTSLYEDALAEFGKAASVYEKLWDEDRLAQIAQNRGSVFLSLSRYEEALASYSEAAWERAETQLGEEAVRISTGMWPMSLINPGVRHVAPPRRAALSWDVYVRELGGARP